MILRFYDSTNTNTDKIKFLQNLYNNEIAFVGYKKMLRANIIFKRFLMAWIVSKSIPNNEKENIHATIRAFCDEMQTRIIPSFIIENVRMKKIWIQPKYSFLVN